PSFEASHAASRLLKAMLEKESALRGLALTHQSRFVDSYRRGAADFEKSVQQVEKGSANDPGELRELDAQVTAVRRWEVLAESRIARIRSAKQGGISALTRSTDLTSARNANQRLQKVLRKEREAHLDRAGLIALGLALMLFLVFAAAYFLIERRRRADADRRANEQRYQETQSDFTETMQVTRSESEAYELLKRHLERSIEEGKVVVFNRNNSDNRLEARTTLPEDSALHGGLRNAKPSSCVAVRLGRAHERGNGRASLLECDLCGRLPGKSTCIPSLVSGEVIGSVLIRHENELRASEHQR